MEEYKDKQCKDCFYATYLGQCLYYYKYTLLDMLACKYFIPVPIIDKKILQMLKIIIDNYNNYIV